MSSGDEAESDSGESEIGHAKTRTPVAGVPRISANVPVQAGANIGYVKTATPEGGTPRIDTESSEGLERPDSDKLARAVAKNRVAAKLFAKPPEEVKLGRYHLLEMVGAGGMGVVWGAWDPELDRRVAIKLVKAEMQAARERIVLEGKALGKLSHPNVVPIYDVGVVDDQIFIVMEWVRGKNLRAYCRQPRTIHEILTLYRAACEGLSAAHRVGLIHRDFKPDNAMIGDDGRVRVLDFGLARGEVRRDSKPSDSEDSEDTSEGSSDLTRGAGTPRYMPPEQAEGAELTPAVDQYALGVSLREALAGRNADGKDADIPRWLNEIIMRATAREASNRYESMDELVSALARDPATVWRRRGIVAAVLALAGGMFVVGTVRAGVEECGGGTEEIEKAWSVGLGAIITEHLTSLGNYGAEEAKRIVPDMTKYAERWAATHKRVCKANERKELSPQLYGVRLACLSRAHVALQTVAEILGRSTKERLPDAIVASRALPEVELCANATSSTMVAPPPSAIKAQVDKLSQEVSRIRYLALAVDPTTTELAFQAAERADKLGYLPLVGRARLALGFGILGDGKGAIEAMPQFALARSAALRAGDHVTFVEAYAREVFAQIQSPDGKQKLFDVDATRAIVEDLAAGTKSEGAFARTLLLNNLGTERLSDGDVPGARVFFERALAEPQIGKRDVELYVVLGNLALATDDAKKREALWLEEHEHLKRELGVNHPFTITSWMRGAVNILDRPDETAKVLRDACGRLREFHPDNQKRIDICSFELGLLAAERDDLVELREAMGAIKSSTNLKIAQGYLLVADGKYVEAARSMEEYGTENEPAPNWSRRLVGATSFLVAATAFEKLGKPADAIRVLKRALEIYKDPQLNDKGSSYIERRIARTKAMAARLLVTSEPETAKSLAKEALLWYRQAGGYESVVTQLEAI